MIGLPEQVTHLAHDVEVLGVKLRGPLVITAPTVGRIERVVDRVMPVIPRGPPARVHVPRQHPKAPKPTVGRLIVGEK